MASDRFGVWSALGQRLVSDSAWRLSTRRLHDGVVYKTHALADELPPDSQAKVVFVFRRPSSIVLSVLAADQRYGSAWTQEHLSHLRATGSLAEVMTKDVLRIEEQIDGWLASEHVDVLGLRYEALWDNVEVLRAYTHLQVVLPPRLPPTKSLVDPTLTHTIESAYAALDRKVQSLPDVALRHGGDD